MAKSKILRIGSMRVKEPKEIPICQSSLQDCLGVQGLGFSHEAAQGGVRFTLSGPGRLRDEDNGYWLLPLFDSHWFGASLKFEQVVDRAEFRSASLIFIRGTKAGAKTKLLRAEWHIAEVGDSDHAQPHWHVYTKSAGKPFMKVAEKVSLRSERRTLGHDLSRFHFAMAAGWHEDKGHRLVPSPDELGGWLGKCVSYTRNQLEFVERKLRKASASRVEGMLQ